MMSHYRRRRYEAVRVREEEVEGSSSDGGAAPRRKLPSTKIIFYKHPTPLRKFQPNVMSYYPTRPSIFSNPLHEDFVSRLRMRRAYLRATNQVCLGKILESKVDSGVVDSGMGSLRQETSSVVAELPSVEQTGKGISLSGEASGLKQQEGARNKKNGTTGTTSGRPKGKKVQSGMRSSKRTGAVRKGPQRAKTKSFPSARGKGKKNPVPARRKKTVVIDEGEPAPKTRVSRKRIPKQVPKTKPKTKRRKPRRKDDVVDVDVEIVHEAASPPKILPSSSLARPEEVETATTSDMDSGLGMGVDGSFADSLQAEDLDLGLSSATDILDDDPDDNTDKTENTEDDTGPISKAAKIRATKQPGTHVAEVVATVATESSSGPSERRRPRRPRPAAPAGLLRAVKKMADGGRHHSVTATESPPARSPKGRTKGPLRNTRRGKLTAKAKTRRGMSGAGLGAKTKVVVPKKAQGRAVRATRAGLKNRNKNKKQKQKKKKRLVIGLPAPRESDISDIIKSPKKKRAQSQSQPKPNKQRLQKKKKKKRGQGPVQQKKKKKRLFGGRGSGRFDQTSDSDSDEDDESFNEVDKLFQKVQVRRLLGLSAEDDQTRPKADAVADADADVVATSADFDSVEAGLRAGQKILQDTDWGIGVDIEGTGLVSSDDLSIDFDDLEIVTTSSDDVKPSVDLDDVVPKRMQKQQVVEVEYEAVPPAAAAAAEPVRKKGRLGTRGRSWKEIEAGLMSDTSDGSALSAPTTAAADERSSEEPDDILLLGLSDNDDLEVDLPLDDSTFSVSSSIEALEELEKVLEEQHQKLIDEGILSTEEDA